MHGRYDAVMRIVNLALVALWRHHQKKTPKTAASKFLSIFFDRAERDALCAGRVAVFRRRAGITTLLPAKRFAFRHEISSEILQKRELLVVRCARWNVIWRADGVGKAGTSIRAPGWFKAPVDWDI